MSTLTNIKGLYMATNQTTGTRILICTPDGQIADSAQRIADRYCESKGLDGSFSITPWSDVDPETMLNIEFDCDYVVT